MTPEETTLLKLMSEQVRDVQKGVGAIGAALSDHKVIVEHRLTKMETRAGLLGMLGGGIITALVAVAQGLTN